jgi:hypothetical protein
MTQISRLACTATALLLTVGMATAADQAEAEPAQPDVTNQAENQPKPKENAADPSPSQNKTAKTDKEPECE